VLRAVFPPVSVLVVCGGGGFLVATGLVYPAYLTKGVCGFVIDLMSLYSNISQFGDFGD
jgi:hypothetical protein